MDKIYSVKYVDAYYSYEKKITQTKLSLFEAHGYVEKNVNNIIIAFIKRKLAYGREEVVLGLVIPDTALVSVVDTYKTDILKNVAIGSSVTVTWRDVVIFDYGDLRNDCPIMYTEGILVKIEKDHIVLKDPETIRIYPNPVRNYPVEKPNYYMIPISFISDITVIK